MLLHPTTGHPVEVAFRVLDATGTIVWRGHSYKAARTQAGTLQYTMPLFHCDSCAYSEGFTFEQCKEVDSNA